MAEFDVIELDVNLDIIDLDVDHDTNIHGTLCIPICGFSLLPRHLSLVLTLICFTSLLISIPLSFQSNLIYQSNISI
jgi:hypothetical protein